MASIKDGMFFQCNSLTNVNIPNSVTEIGSSAFSGCSSLTNITIPENVTEIKNHTFSNCDNLTSITIPDSVISIGEYAFRHLSKLASIYIPHSVTKTGKYLFYENENPIFIDIYCGATSRPDGWNQSWSSYCDYDVFWGASRSDYDAIIAGTFDVAEPVIAFTTDGNTCSITSDTTFAHIYYTTDGSEPTTENGTLYEAPFAVEEGNTVKAVAYVGMETYSDIVTERFSATGGSTS